MKKKISIIIPVYNAEKYIAKCLDSIVCQAQDDYEILVIDDGSIDESKKIIQGYEEKYSRIVHGIYKKNEGAAKTRNMGIQQARGKYVCFVDNDDYVENGYFITLLEEIEKGYDIVIGGYKRVEDQKVRFQVTPQNTNWYKYVVTAPWAKMYRKDFLINNNVCFLDYGLGEDIYFSIVGYSYTDKIKVVNCMGYNWFFNMQSVSNTSQRKANQNLDPIYLLNKIYEEVGVKKIEYAYFYIRYGIWYLLFSGRGCSKQEFVCQYQRLFQWYNEKDIVKRFPLVGEITKGERITVKLAINVFLILHKMKLINLFAKFYCKG